MKRTLDIKYYVAGAVSLITFIVYLPSLANNFVMWDDGVYVVTNYHIHSFNLGLFRWAFFEFYSSNWHPLTWISHALDYAVWGLNPLGHILTNIILHAVNAFIVVLLTMKLLRAGKEATAQTGLPGFMNARGILVAAGATGLLFGLHPVHVESVAWVAERKDLLCALFFLLGIIKYVDYAGSAIKVMEPKKLLWPFFEKRYLFTLGFFVLALLSKPMAVTFPVVLLILDWQPFNRIRSVKTFLSVLVEKTPFFLLSLISSIITISAQHKAMMLSINAPLSVRPLVAVDSLVRYLGKMIWPLNLVPFYPYPNNVSLFSFRYLFALVLAVGITVACSAVVKKQKIWLTAWCFFIVTLIPVIGLVQVGSQAMADRYMYLPSLGPFIIMGLGAAWISAKAFPGDKPSLFVQLFSAAAVIIVLFAMTYLTVGQIGIWKNRLELWTYVVKKEPAQSPFPYNNLGLAYVDKGLTAQAIEQYKIALKFDPNDADFHVNLGQAYADKGLFAQAVEQYQLALRSDPGHALAHNNLGVALKKQGSIDKAVEHYQNALILEPDNALFHNNLGVAYEDNGLKDKALEQYRIALQLDPENALAHSNLGAVYVKEGSLDEAIRHFLVAVRSNPDYALAHYNLAEAYMRKGLIDQAIEQYQIVLTLFPDSVLAHTNLGEAYARKGLIDLAIEQDEAAIKLKPENFDAHTNLGVAYLKKGLEKQAIQQFRLAATLQPESPRAHSNLGAAYGKAGFDDKAIEQFRIAVKLDPANPTYRKNLDLALKRNKLR